MTGQNIEQAAVVGRVETGVQYFIDTPPDDEGYFYAVLLRSPDGTTHAVLIPFRNKTLAAISVRAPASEEQAAARVTDIKAAPAAGGDGVEVTFQVSNQGRDLLLFRSTSPIAVPGGPAELDVRDAAGPGTTRYVLPGLPGVDYWFAVLDAGMFKLGQAPLVRGENTTRDPVQVPLASGRISACPPAPPAGRSPCPRSKSTSACRPAAISAIRRARPRAGEAGVRCHREGNFHAPQPPAPEPPQLPAAARAPGRRHAVPGAGAGVLQGIVHGPFLGGDMTQRRRSCWTS